MTTEMSAERPATPAAATLRTGLPRPRRPLDRPRHLDELRARLTGPLAEPGDPAYDDLVTPWNLHVAMRPAAAVAVATADDVAETVRFAGARGLTVGVQATGHGAISGIAGDLLVLTRGLDEVSVHAEERWARVGSGVKWLRVIQAAVPHGLAPLNGSTSDVGVVGYTTGGGVGPMARQYGRAADHVRAFEVVTGDGVLRRVTPTEHPDLFFALRGGKGAGGIVTAVEFDLVAVPRFYGGAVYFDGTDAGRVLDVWRDWADRLPADVATTSFALFQLPPMPGVPEPLAGRISLSIRLLWTGDPDEGARALDEVRTVAPVILNDAALKPYTAVDSVHADPVDPMPAVERSTLLSAFPAQAAETLLGVAGVGSGSPQVMVEVRRLGGAYARPARYPDAFDHRDAQYSLLTVGLAPDADSAALAEAHGELVLASMAEWDTGRVWPNFAPPFDDDSAGRAYDAATLARLREVAASYDPGGVLAAARYARTSYWPDGRD